MDEQQPKETTKSVAEEEKSRDDTDPIKYYFLSKCGIHRNVAKIKGGKSFIYSFVSSTEKAEEMKHFTDKRLVWSGRTSELEYIRRSDVETTPQYYVGHSTYVTSSIQGLPRNFHLNKKIYH